MEVSTVHDGAWVLLTVADDGQGDAATITAALEKQGTFGLPHLARRVTRAGGSFSVEQRAGRGILIQVAVPLLREPTGEMPAPRAEATTGAGGPGSEAT